MRYLNHLVVLIRDPWCKDDALRCHIFRPVRLGTDRSRFRLIHLPGLFNRPSPDLLLGICNELGLFCGTRQAAVIPDSDALICALRVRNPGLRVSLVFLVNRTYGQYFRVSVLPRRLCKRLRHFPLMGRVRPGP